MNNTEATLKILTSFPSYQRWESFLKKQSPGLVAITKNPKLEVFTSASFRTPNGTLNKVSFRNLQYSEGIDLHPYQISQDYSDKELGSEVEINLNRRNLNVRLKLDPKSELIGQIMIESDQYVPKNKDFAASQGIVIRLKDEYKRKLIERGIIPQNAENFIRIKDYGGVRSVKIETDRRRSSAELSEDSLRVIQQEIDFNWDMNGEETKGTFGDISFTVKHVNPLSLDPESVWDSLTGKEGRQFIFPVEVKKIDSK